MGQTNIKPIKGKFLTKHQTAAEWDLCNDGAGAQYIPDLGELVIYDPDESYQFVRLKFGDGEKIVKELPFAFEEKLSSSDIVNTLTSEAVEYPLSAAQGKELKRLLDELAQSTVQSINSLQDTKIGVSDVVDSLDSTEKNKPLSANQGRLLKENFGNYVTETELKEAIDAIPTPDVSGQINQHNINSAAHDDIRALISKLRKDLDTLANSDDVNLDQLSEIVAYIKSNKALIEAITTSKVNVSDIIDNLTTNASDKPLSAAQGVALKALIDAIVIPNYEPAGTEFGLMKTGGDLTITNGIATVNDNSHGHIISNIGGLQEALDGRTVVGEEVLDNNIAYIKEVPAKSAPYARIDAVGGMTRKCTNLIPYPYENTTQTKNGVAFTDNGDGTITVNGTATGDTYFVLKAFTLNKGNYILSGCPSGGAFDKHMLYLEKGVSANDFGNSASFTLAESADIQAVIRIYTNQTVSNLTFKPMLNSGSTALPYEPYFEGLRSASTERIESVGVNKFDIDNRQHGTIDSNGDLKCEESTKTFYTYPFKENTRYTLSGYVKNHNTTGNIRFRVVYTDGTSENTVLLNNSTEWAYRTYTTEAGKTVDRITVWHGDVGYMYIKGGELMINEGTTAQPYTPYVKHTLPIPEAVRPLHGINENVYDSIEWGEDGKQRSRVKCGVVDLGTLDWGWDGAIMFVQNCFNSSTKAKWVNASTKFNCISTFGGGVTFDNVYGTTRGFCTDVNGLWLYCAKPGYTDAAAFKAAMQGVMLVYELATPTTEDISDILGADNYIGVEGGGTLTFVNEYGYDVPSEVTWYENSNDVIGAEEFVGDLIGTAVRAISDKNGNDITETYVTKDDLVDLGSGDMLKSVYDTDGDGVVDNAEKLGGVAAADYAKKSDIPAAITVDSALSSTSTNPVQNKVVNSALSEKLAASTFTAHTATHAPSNAQKNSDITKAEIEAKLTGTISSHSHTVSHPVTSVAGKTGAVTLAKGDVGLGNVDNTADSAKSVKYATSAGSASSATTATTVLRNVTDNKDVNIWKVYSDNDGEYGFRLQYDASGSGNNNSLSLVADNQNGTEVVAMKMLQDGTTTFAKAITASGGITGNLTGNATSATTASSVAWGNVSGKPSTFTPASHTHTVANISDLTATATELNYVDGVTSNIQTQLNGKATLVNLNGQCQVASYRTSIIALCYSPTHAATNLGSHSVGKLSFTRVNGLYAPCTADISMVASHGSVGCIYTRYIKSSSFQIFEPCTFTYNGVAYGGVKVKTSEAEASYVKFEGYTTFPIFALDIYDSNSKTILNEEVYNSISSDTIHVMTGWYDGTHKLISTEDIGSQSVNYATSAGSATSATKATQDGSGNTITSTYATKTELTNGLAGKVSKSGDTMTGKLRVDAPILGYNYVNGNNLASFIFDKPGSNLTGIGANGESDTIYFGAVGNIDTGAWNHDLKQKWKFNGDVTADKYNVGGGCNLQYDSTEKSLKFVFA